MGGSWGWLRAEIMDRIGRGNRRLAGLRSPLNETSSISNVGGQLLHPFTPLVQPLQREASPCLLLRVGGGEVRLVELVLMLHRSAGR